MGKSPSPTLLHMWVVTGTQFLLASCVTWLTTFKLLSGFSQAKKKGIPLRGRPMSQMLAASVCIGFSIGLPLECAQMIVYDQARDKLSRSDDKDDTLTDHLDESVALPIVIMATIFWFGSALLSISLSISKIDVFDSTMSEMSNRRKLCYRNAFIGAVVSVLLWLIWFSIASSLVLVFVSITVFTLMFLAVLLMMLAREFASRLSEFLEFTKKRNSFCPAPMTAIPATTMTQSSNDLNCGVGGSLKDLDESPIHTSAALSTVHSVSSVSPSGTMALDSSTVSFPSSLTLQSKMSSSDQSLLKVIIKQSLLSCIQVASLLINGFVFILSVLFTEGVLNAYTRIGITQSGTVVPLCIYLSYEFADRDYKKLCNRPHKWFVNRTMQSYVSN